MIVTPNINEKQSLTLRERDKATVQPGCNKSILKYQLI